MKHRAANKSDVKGRRCLEETSLGEDMAGGREVIPCRLSALRVTAAFPHFVNLR